MARSFSGLCDGAVIGTQGVLVDDGQERILHEFVVKGQGRFVECFEHAARQTERNERAMADERRGIGQVLNGPRQEFWRETIAKSRRQCCNGCPRIVGVVGEGEFDLFEDGFVYDVGDGERIGGANASVAEFGWLEQSG